jgi:hypothetical protein
LVTTAIYIVDLNLFTAWWLGLINIVIYIIITIVLLSKPKKSLMVFFIQRSLYHLISAIIGLALSVCFNMLFNVIDPGAKDTIKELTIKYMVTEKFNVSCRDS